MVSISTIGDLNCSMPPVVLRKFNANKDDFQMIPESAAQALELIKDPSCELAVVARAIEKDVKLSASILTVANSPLYSPGRPITCVRDAIINVGFRQCHSLIQACCAKSLMQAVPVDRVAGEAIIRHCLYTASFASAMNRSLSLRFQGEEFTAGLLHDLGRLLLGALFPESFPALHEVQRLGTVESLKLEEEIIGTDHAVVGCYFAIANRLPEELTEAIRFHHEPEAATCAPKLTATTAVAAELSAQCLTNSDDAYDVADNPYLPAFAVAYGQEKRDELESKIASIVELAAEILSSLHSPT